MNYKEYLKESIGGIVVKTKSPRDPILKFDLKAKTITVEQNGKSKTWKVVPSREFTFKIQKKQVNAIDGIDGLYKTIKKAVDEDFATDLYFPAFKRGLEKYGN